MGLRILLVLVTLSVAITDQISAAGSWSVESVGWSMYLKPDGSRLTGMVSQCGTARQRLTDIEEGRVDGNKVSFKCTRIDRNLTLQFTGQLLPDAMVINWTKTLRAGTPDTPGVDKIFGAATSGTFTAARIADGELAQAAADTRGSEFAGAINLPASNTKSEGTLFVPEGVSRVRTVITVIRYGVGVSMSSSRAWRELAASVDGALLGVNFSPIGPKRGGLMDVDPAEGGADALLGLLRQLSVESKHPELNTAPLVLWGHSAGGGIASLLAAEISERTLAFVRYHSGPVTGDVAVISKLPSLSLSGGRDTTAPPPAAEALWRSGRAAEAPWTFGVRPDAEHSDLGAASGFMTLWIQAVVRLRLPGAGSTLYKVSGSSGWLGDNRSGLIAPHDEFTGPKSEASWFPDETTARAWRQLLAIGK